MNSNYLCRLFGVKGFRLALVALVVLVTVGAVSTPAFARQDISAGNSLQFQDTHDSPLGDGGLRGDPDGGEGAPSANLPDDPHQDTGRTNASFQPDTAQVSAAPFAHRISSFFRLLCESIRRVSK
jgi:hypothetical protein